MSENSQVQFVYDSDSQIQSWSEAIEVIEMLLDDLKIIETASKKVCEDIEKLDKPATKEEEEQLEKLLIKYKKCISSTELKLLSAKVRSWRK